MYGLKRKIAGILCICFFPVFMYAQIRFEDYVQKVKEAAFNNEPFADSLSGLQYIVPFISASNKAMNELVEGRTVEKESVSVLLKNSLVLVVPKDNAAKIEKVEDLANLDEKSKLAIGACYGRQT